MGLRTDTPRKPFRDGREIRRRRTRPDAGDARHRSPDSPQNRHGQQRPIHYRGQHPHGHMVSGRRAQQPARQRSTRHRRLQRRPRPRPQMAGAAHRRRDICRNHPLQRNPRLCKKSAGKLRVLRQYPRRTENFAQTTAGNRSRPRNPFQAAPSQDRQPEHHPKKETP